MEPQYFLGRALIVTGAMLAMALSSSSLGMARDFLNLLLADACLFVGAGTGVISALRRIGGVGGERVRGTWNALFVVLLALLAMAVLPHVPRPVRPLVVGAVAAGLLLPGVFGERIRSSLRAVAAGSVPFSAYLLLCAAPTFVRTLRDHWAHLLSSATSFVSGTAVELGPSVAGVDLVVLAALCAWTWPPRKVSALRRAAQAGSLIALQAAFALLVVPLLTFLQAYLDPAGRLGLSAFDLGGVLALLLGCFLAAVHGTAEAAMAPENLRVPRVVRIALPLGLAVLLGLGMVGTEARAGIGKRAPVRVAIHDPGTLDRRIDEEEMTLGQSAVGMFGFLQPFLELCGYRVDHVDLEGADLSPWDVLIVINPYDGFTPETLGRIHTFVEGGGGLLVAGDHTGMEHIRDPANAILQPWHIELRFDSAIALRSSWADGMQFLHHPITRELSDEIDSQIWTGASLEVSPPARPLIVGRAAYSDRGNPENPDGSNLGDFAHHLDERLGDVPLVAAAEPGRGRVLAFGDTSPLQSDALGETRPFVRDCIEWLAHRSGGSASSSGRGLRTLLLCLLVAGGAVSWIRGARLLSVLAALLLVEGLAERPHSWDTPPLRAKGRPIAHIDVSHGENLTRLGWYPLGIGGLQQCLFRAGFWPFLPRTFRFDLAEEASLLCVCAPTCDFSVAEREWLLGWMDRGGVLLLAVGRPESERVRGLLGSLGVAIGTTPLGPAEDHIEGGRFRFQNAYPLSRIPEGAEVLVKAFGFPVSAWIPHGSGGALVVSDSRFFTNQNLEDFDSYVPENLAYVVQLLKQLRERGVTPL